MVILRCKDWKALKLQILNDDDDDDDDELFCGMDDRRKAFETHLQPGLLWEILTITNLQHAASRSWICA